MSLTLLLLLLRACTPLPPLPLHSHLPCLPYLCVCQLATLRLQNMVGISLAHWSDLQPNDERCLTQLGGLLAVDPDGNMIYEWRDNGICAVANFEELLEAL